MYGAGVSFCWEPHGEKMADQWVCAEETHGKEETKSEPRKNLI
jgi:hypothetical protein